MAERVGFRFDPWQAEVVEAACLTRDEGQWAALEVGLNVARQCGKGGILEIVQLTTVFTWESVLTIHSAHEAVTSRLHFDRIWGLIQNTPDLLRRVYRQKANYSHGQEGFKLVDGREMMFRTRTKGGGRGFACDHLFLDEAMILPEEALAALFPTLRAKDNPQVWYTGSAVDQESHQHGVVFTRIRKRGIEGEDPALAYLEWSLDYDDPELVPEPVFNDPDEWRKATPAWGIRIFPEHMLKELNSLPRRTFAVELLGVGDYPDTSGSTASPISAELWAECEDAESELQDPVCLSFDTSPGRRTALCASGRNQWGDWHTEVIEKLPGTEWLAERLLELESEHDVAEIVCDKLGPAGSIVPALEDRGLRVRTLDSAEHAQACGSMVDIVSERKLRHVGSLDLWNAIRGAVTRPLLDRWAWSRKNSTVDISPLVACTLGLWSAMGQPEQTGEVDIY